MNRSGSSGFDAPSGGGLGTVLGPLIPVTLVRCFRPLPWFGRRYSAMGVVTTVLFPPSQQQNRSVEWRGRLWCFQEEYQFQWEDLVPLIFFLTVKASEQNCSALPALGWQLHSKTHVIAVLAPQQIILVCLKDFEWPYTIFFFIYYNFIGLPDGVQTGAKTSCLPLRSNYQLGCVHSQEN